MQASGNIFKNLHHYLTRQTEEASHQILLFAVVMMINFPLFGVLWRLENPPSLEEGLLRIFASILCIILVSSQYWPSSLFKFLPWLWYITLLFCLPFFFTYLTLFYHCATLWLMNCVSAIFFLLLVTQVVDAIILLAIGSGLALLCFFANPANTIEYIPGEISLFSLMITFTAAIIIGALFARDRELMHAGRISGMKLLAGSLAHDLRTPLASIHLQAELQEIIVEKLNNAEVQKDLKESLDKIIRGIEMGNQLIGMQLNNIQRDKFDTSNFSIYSVSSILMKTLDDYPLKDEQKKLINIDFCHNFSIWVEEIAFKNLIWNLLKNSLDSIEESGKGEISIWLTEGAEKDDFNYLHIKDTAKGIYPKKIERIFDAFYSNRKGGTGVGLAYCKLFMQAAGGDIFCKGKIDQFAHFILKFPKID